jgi:nicotinamide mononucleotide transporter
MLHWIAGHYIEIFGAATGILYVFLEIRQKVWLWPLGIITSAIYVVVFFNSKFYADMGLQFYYIFISIYGWYWWTKGGKSYDSDKLPVTSISSRQIIYAGFVFVLLFAGIWTALSNLTDSPVPGWDSFTTSVSIIATWMLARKYIEHWLLWIVANTVSMGLYIYKGLYPTVVLFAVYTIMAFAGYYKWRPEIHHPGKDMSVAID